MNKKDFWILIMMDVIFVGLLIEAFVFNLELAFWLLTILPGIYLVAHVYILRDYIKDMISIKVEEDEEEY